MASNKTHRIAGGRVVATRASKKKRDEAIKDVKKTVKKTAKKLTKTNKSNTISTRGGVVKANKNRNAEVKNNVRNASKKAYSNMQSKKPSYQEFLEKQNQNNAQRNQNLVDRSKESKKNTETKKTASSFDTLTQKQNEALKKQGERNKKALEQSRKDVKKAYEKSKNIDSVGVYHDPNKKEYVKTNLAELNAQEKQKAKKKIQGEMSKAFSDNKSFAKMFRELGYSNDAINNAWNQFKINPDEAKKTKALMEIGYMRSANKQIDKELPSKVEKKFLTSDDMAKVQYAETLDPRTRKDYLKNYDKKYGTDIATRLGDVQAQQYFTGGGRFGQGLIEGASPVSIMQGNDNTGAVYSDNAKKFIKQGQSSGAYTVGNIGGMLAAGTAGGMSGLEAGLAKGLMSQGAKSTAKTVLAKNIANTAVGAPLDFVDAIKNSYDEKGKIDVKAFVKNLGINLGASSVLGGAIEGAGAIVKQNQLKRLGGVINKLNNGIGLDDDDFRLLKKMSAKEETGYVGFDKGIEKANANIGKYNLDDVKDISDANKRVSVINKSAKSVDMAMQNADELKAKMQTGVKKQSILESVADTPVKDEPTTKGPRKTKGWKAEKKAEKRAKQLRKKVDRIELKEIEREIKREELDKQSLEAKAQRRAKIEEEAKRHNVEAKKNNALVEGSAEHKEVVRQKVESEKRLANLESNLKSALKRRTPKDPYGRKAHFKRIDLLRKEIKDESMRVNMLIDQANNVVDVRNLPSSVNIKASPNASSRSTIDVERINNVHRIENEIKDYESRIEKIKSRGSHNIYELSRLSQHNNTIAKLKKELDSLSRNNGEAKMFDKVVENPTTSKSNSTVKAETKSNSESVRSSELNKPTDTRDASQTNSETKPGYPFKTDVKNVGPETLKSRISAVISKGYRKVFNDLNGLERIAKRFDTKAERESFRAIVNDIRKSFSMADNSVNGDVRYTFDGKATGDMSLNKIYTTFGLHKDSVKLKDFERYAMLMHHIESTSIGKPLLFKDGKALTISDARAEIEKLNGKYPESGVNIKDSIGDFHREIVGFGKYLLDYRRDSGLISANKYKKLRHDYPNYVPFFREDFDKDLKKQIDSDDIILTDAIWRRKGGKGEVASLYNSLSSYTYLVTQNAHTNRVMNELYNSSISNGNYNVRFYKNGNIETLNVDKEIYDGMRDFANSNKSSMYEFFEKNGFFNHNPLPALNNAYKELISDFNILFGVRNVTKDNLTAVVFTQNLRGYIANLPEAIRQVTTNGEIYKLYMASGGRYSNFVNGKSLDRNAKGLKKFMSMSVNGKYSPLRCISEFNDILETIPRVSEFTSALKEFGGDDIIEDLSKLSKTDISRAMYRANDITTNFSRNGVWGRTANRNFVPFLNASLQGMDKLRRIFSETAENGLFSKEMAGLVGKFTAFSIAPSLANELLNAGNTDFQWLTDRDKDNYYCIPIGDGEFIKIPKARETSVIAMPMNYILRYGMYGKANGDNPITEWKNLCANAWELAGVINPWTDNIFSGATNVAKNKTYWGGYINNEDDMKFIANGDNWKCYDENTSAVAKWLGAKNRLNRSPKSIDRLMDNYLGFIYDMGIKPTSAKYYSSSDSKTDILRNWAANIGKSNFMIDALFSSKPADNYFSKLDSADPVTNKEMNQNYTGDISLYSSGIHEVLALDKNTAEKTKDARELRRLRMQVYMDGVHGNFNNANPINDLCKVFGIKHVFTSHEYMNVDEEHAGSSYYGWFNNLSKTDEYKKNPNKHEKEFLNIYNSCHKISRKIGIGDLYPDRELLALDIVRNKRSGVVVDSITKDFFNDTMKLAKNYLGQYRRSINDYVKTQKGLIKSARTLGYDYIGEMSSAQKSVAIANNNPKATDAEYYISGCGMRTYQGRAVATKYNWTDKKFDKFLKHNGLDKATLKEKGINEVTPAMAKKAVDSASCKSPAEAAALYALLVTRFVKDNPYGNFDSMPVSGDVGIENNYYAKGNNYYAKGSFSHRHYRKYRHRGWKNYSNKYGYSQFNNYDVWLKKHKYSSSSKSSKSSLTEAFRKRQLKNLQATSANKK